MSEDDADGLDYKVQTTQTIQVGQQLTPPNQASNNTTAPATPNSSQSSTHNNYTNASAQMVAQPESKAGPNMIDVAIVAIIVIVGISALVLVRKRPKANYSVES